MQHAIDPKAHVASVASWLEMDVARTLLERVGEKPIADVNDVLIICVELARASELDELLKVRDLTVGALVLRTRALDRFGEIEEFDDVTLDVERICNYALDVKPQDLLERLLPITHMRITGRDRCFGRCHAHRQDSIALRICS